MPVMKRVGLLFACWATLTVGTFLMLFLVRFLAFGLDWAKASQLPEPGNIALVVSVVTGFIAVKIIENQEKWQLEKDDKSAGQ